MKYSFVILSGGFYLLLDNWYLKNFITKQIKSFINVNFFIILFRGNKGTIFVLKKANTLTDSTAAFAAQKDVNSPAQKVESEVSSTLLQVK